MGIAGTLPPDLGNLSFLLQLDIGNNSFHGNLPPEMARLRRLRDLDLKLNPSVDLSLLGSIPPSISNASKLEILILANNHLQGGIPSEIGKLQYLKTLGLDANQLSGSVPLGIFNSSLEVVSLLQNGLSVDLPQDICRYSPRLQYLGTSFNNFSGSIPSSLYKCTSIEILSLSYNTFNGRISSEIGNLTMLKELYLGYNNLSGEIPLQLGSLVNLEVLSVDGNFLKGSVPSAIFNISSLNRLFTGDNRLSGSLPWNMCYGLPQIEVLGLGHNEFTGSLPSSIANCTFLTHFSVVNNKFTGELPSTIGNLANIDSMLLDLNDFSGIIPESMCNASKLTTLDLSENSFSGFIPSKLHHLENIEFLNLGKNNLTANSNVFLTQLTNCLYLKVLWLDGNPLKITLPDTIGDFPNLQKMSLASTKTVGNIPVEIFKLSKLISLSLEDNDLVGTVPKTIGQLWKLQLLDLRGNKLQGHLPTSVCGLSDLVYLLLSSNQLSGSLPLCLGKLTFLSEVQMDSNRFTSISSIWSIKSLLILNVSSNLLAGELPVEIGNLKVANSIDLSNNQISGEIPSTIGSLSNLVDLSLAENTLGGPIPPSLGSLTSLEFLNLSHNKLIGTIPKSFEKLSFLHYLNLSSNELEGEIPQGGRFTNFTFLSFLPNRDLCGLPKFHVRPCSTARRRRSPKRSVIVLKYILPAFSSFVLITMVLLFIWMGRRKKSIRTTDQENSISPILPKRFSQLELLRATNGFAESNLLGKGSFSSVYKGTLSDETTIVVKVFNLHVEGSLRSFDIECEVLRNVRHRNLVKVIGSCSNLDYKALVIDYMSNGSLEEWLHEPEHEHLDILQRMDIMIDVASALEYLHHGYSTVIVHCDVKPSKILLDEDMVARLGDYGIAKLFGEQQFSDQTKTLATIGYISPEYGSEGIVSAKGDVYSYGITLLEMFTRKKPTDKMFDGEMSLKRWVMESVPHGISEIIDADILRERSSNKEHCLKAVMELALSCCAELPEERVDVKEVANKMKNIKLDFLKST